MFVRACVADMEISAVRLESVIDLEIVPDPDGTVRLSSCEGVNDAEVSGVFSSVCDGFAEAVTEMSLEIDVEFDLPKLVDAVSAEFDSDCESSRVKLSQTFH